MNKEKTIEKIVKKCRENGILKPEQIQYVLATVEHETAGKFQPVKETFWEDEEWRKKKLKYYPYYGRGFVQITWKANYEKFGKLLNLDLVGSPDLALESDTALSILVIGMRDGLFTGKKLGDYMNENGSNFIDARRIVNGLDKATSIAYLAQKTRVGKD